MICRSLSYVLLHNLGMHFHLPAIILNFTSEIQIFPSVKNLPSQIFLTFIVHADKFSFHRISRLPQSSILQHRKDKNHGLCSWLVTVSRVKSEI
jgi:hypothetical protein